MKAWRLDDPRQTLVLVQEGSALPGVIYWGAPLPADEDLATLAASQRLDVTGGMMDANAPLSICPEARQGWAGQPGFVLIGRDGRRVMPTFSASVEAWESELRITAKDADCGVVYHAQIALTDDGMLQTCAKIDAPGLAIDWLATPVLPVSSASDGLIDFSGRWIGEFQRQRHDWRPGVHMREARMGRSGHEHPPFAILTTPGTTNSQGEAWALSYDWSGGHRMVAEELPDGRRQIQFGHAPGSHTSGRACTATLTACYSADGLNGSAGAFQRHVRAMTQGNARHPRPVHYNCWEAIYFNHDPAELQDIARRAADLGAERFVLDDGWFGMRDDDTTSLGDWAVDPRKWPDGLRPFAEYVQALGMEFGLWVEPEMINKDSDLFRAHPDWLLGPVDQTPGRQQFVLDLSQRAVCDYLFDRLNAVLNDAPIGYLKWDHNRLLPVVDERQVLMLNALLGRLRTAHPGVEIESCASGGGRIDLNILQHTGRVWLSDSNDAAERLRIQHDAALFLPASVTGSHVGPRNCHTSGRIHDIRFRAWVAAQRHMGFEMDPRELTEEEAQVLKSVTAWWKANRDWRMEADILRLDHADPAMIAELQLAQDGSRFVAFAGQTATSSQILPRPLCLTGLDPQARYRITLLNADEAPGLSRGAPALKYDSLTLSGQALMRQGVALPWRFPDGIWVLEGERLP
ncbi:MAG: alpha-galactosidase [Mameliella sp.]|nr:alpha-galactosidase [Mameliella sp.]